MSDELEPYDPDAVAQAIYHQRKIGSSFAEIQSSLGKKYGLTISQVVNLYRSFTKSLMEAYGPEERPQLLGLELERLDALQNSYWGLAVGGDDKAANVVLKTIQMRAKLLGLDVPDGTDKNVQQTVLVIGDDRQRWIEALEHGKAAGRTQIMPGAPADDES